MGAQADRDEDLGARRAQGVPRVRGLQRFAGLGIGERLAAFLLNMSQRFTARGFSASEFNLRMTREEIGSYLGLKLETVSRAFSRFQEDGLISVQQKHVQLLDPAGLKRLIQHQHGAR